MSQDDEKKDPEHVLYSRPHELHRHVVRHARTPERERPRDDEKKQHDIRERNPYFNPYDSAHEHIKLYDVLDEKLNQPIQLKHMFDLATARKKITTPT